MSANRVSDLTIDEFKELIRETVREVLREQEQDEYDPDEGLDFKPEVAQYLSDVLENGIDESTARTLEDVAKELGLDV